MNAECIVDCPFSLAGDEAPVIFGLLEAKDEGVRLPFRKLGLPFGGALAQRVSVRFRSQPDATERGRAHDELAFDWTAGTRLLPDFHGVLRFRAEGTKTRAILHGTYRPPFGMLGAIFDRLIGQRLAHATANDVLERLARELQTQFESEKGA